MKLASIDIGSNSIKLVVVEAAAGNSFAVLASEREVVRLGQETLVNRHIGEVAKRRAIDCLKRFRAVAETHGAETIAAIATASVREANNAQEFIRAVEHETGLRVEVLSGIEEARLVGLAASQGCTDKGLTSLNIDIGGGSTEISIFRDGEPLKLVSVKLGAVGLTDRFIRSDPPAPDELDQLRSEIRSSLQSIAGALLQQGWDYTTATSGTAVTIAAAFNGTTTIALPELKRLNAKLASLTMAERSTIMHFAPQRADIIVAGGFVLEETMNALAIASLRVCEWSLREGVIIDRLRSAKRSTDSVASVAGEKIHRVR
ncbi:MAG: ethanolamine ammonia-lyase reactivating factor EutA [Acidobacteria bacterium]|nr:ethanolamine ammonia-lyase reactivating factor EutA [Acidobacteriota bacterium]